MEQIYVGTKEDKMKTLKMSQKILNYASANSCIENRFLKEKLKLVKDCWKSYHEGAKIRVMQSACFVMHESVLLDKDATKANFIMKYWNRIINNVL